MTEAALLKYKAKDKEYVRYRVVTPKQPLQVLEMDIKCICADHHLYTSGIALEDGLSDHRHKSDVIILQPADILSQEVHIELRNDNGPQFRPQQSDLADNHIGQVFHSPIYSTGKRDMWKAFILKKALKIKTFWSTTSLKKGSSCSSTMKTKSRG
jgi:putative transposase